MRSASAKLRRPAGCLAGLDRRLDLGLRNRRRRVFGAAQRQHAQHVVEVRRRPCARWRRRPSPICFWSIAVLTVADQVEHARQARPRCSGRRASASSKAARAALAARCTRGARRPPSAVEPVQEVGEPAQRLFGLLHPDPGEIQLLAVVRRQQQVAQRRQPEAARRRCRCSV